MSSKRSRTLLPIAVAVLWAASPGCVGDGEAVDWSNDVASTEDPLNVEMRPDGTFNEQSGHFWVTGKAFSHVQSKGMLPTGLALSAVRYGNLFADEPWIGRPETLLSSPPRGATVNGVREDLKGTFYNYDSSNDNACANNVHLRYVWSKTYLQDDSTPAPALYLQIHGWDSEGGDERIAAENATHYPNDGIGTYGDKVTWSSNVRGDAYGATLWRLSRKFWPGSSTKPSPRLSKDLVSVASPGAMTIHTPEWCSNITKAVPPTYLGGNPFIRTTTGGATWPVWVPDTYSVTKLTTDAATPSKRASGVYLGWALHLLQDLSDPYHAVNRGGGSHSPTESFVDYLIRSNVFDHLPVTSGSYAYWRGSAPNTDYLDYRAYGTKRDMCRAMPSLDSRFTDAWQRAKPHFDAIKDVTSIFDPGADEALGVYEYLLDTAIKESIRLMACVDVEPDCYSDADCSDGDAYTRDTCSNDRCYHQRVQCLSPADCDDWRECTIDTCTSAGYCQHRLRFPRCLEP